MQTHDHAVALQKHNWIRRFTTFSNSPSAFNQTWQLTTALPIRPEQLCPGPRYYPGPRWANTDGSPAGVPDADKQNPTGRSAEEERHGRRGVGRGRRDLLCSFVGRRPAAFPLWGCWQIKLSRPSVYQSGRAFTRRWLQHEAKGETGAPTLAAPVANPSLLALAGV